MAELPLDAITISAQPGPQEALISCPAFELFLGGARGGGKSYGIVLDWIAHATKYGRHARGIVFRRSMPEFEELRAICRDLLEPLGWVFKEQKATWVGPNGARLLFRYLERDADADSYKGFSFTFLAIDEVADWPSPEPVDKLRAILRSAVPGVKVRMLLTGNPGGKGHEWVKERYIDPAKPMTIFTNSFGLTQCFIPSTIKDNPALLANDPTYINRLRASGPPWLVRAWLEGDWTIVMEGKVFKHEMFVYETLPAAIRDELASGTPATALFDFVCHAWDTAVKDKEENDYSAVTVWGRVGTRYYLLDAWHGKMGFGPVKDMMGEFYRKWGANLVIIEDRSSGSGLIQELRRAPVMPPEIILPTGPFKGFKGTDKVSRAYSIVPIFISHSVVFPKDAAWLGSYVNELLSFGPDCAHDDWVDSTVYALDYMAHRLNYNRGPGVTMASDASIFGR